MKFLGRLDIHYTDTHVRPILENMAHNIGLPHPRLQGLKPHKGHAVIAAGGPSLRHHMATLTNLAHSGAQIFAVNEVNRYLLEQGIRPAYAVAAAPWEITTDCIFGGDPQLEYLISSACPPSTFDKIADGRTTIWHPLIGCGEDKVLTDLETASYTPIPGGPTVGLRALSVAVALGFRRLSLFGLDCVYSEQASHAYASVADSLPPGRQIVIECAGRCYTTTPELAGQIIAFADSYHELRRSGAELEAFCAGPVPDILCALKAGQEAPAVMVPSEQPGDVTISAEMF